jgi:HAD superfamily hydrolase (TIGR01509 family)
VTSPIRAVVFDLFDTLVDLRLENVAWIEHRGTRLPGTISTLHAAFAREHPETDFDRFVETLREVDSEFRTTRYAKGLELPTLERFETLLERLGTPNDALAEELTQLYMSGLFEHVRPVGHHVEVLDALQARVPLALCSNFSHTETALRVLRESGLHDHFDVLVVSDTAGVRKPRPEIFQAVLDELGTAPAETLHVGDNLTADVGGAGALGFRTAWVTRRVRDPEQSLKDHQGPAPDHQIRDLSELLALLD